MTGPETDLAYIEAALAEGRVTAGEPRERELQELALALKADSPQPRPAFAAELDQRVAAGFPKAKPKRRLPVPSLWIPALATACLVIVVAVVAINSTGGSSSTDSTAPSGAGLEAAQPTTTPDRGLVAGGTSAGASDRHVERS